MRQVFIYFVLAVVTAIPVAAQTVSALKAHNLNQPIDITSEQFVIRERANIALFDGTVKAVQGNMTLHADAVKVFYQSGSDSLDILRLDAEGAVRLESPSEQASAKWAIYDVESALITMGGEVELIRGDTRILGERLEIDLRSGLTTLDGAASGTERVRGRFSVPPKPQTQPDTPPRP